jgi:hypothetical protein
MTRQKSFMRISCSSDCLSEVDLVTKLENDKLRTALQGLVDAPSVHDNWCAYPDGPCGGMGSTQCNAQARYTRALAHAISVLKNCK